MAVDAAKQTLDARGRRWRSQRRRQREADELCALLDALYLGTYAERERSPLPCHRYAISLFAAIEQRRVPDRIEAGNDTGRREVGRAAESRRARSEPSQARFGRVVDAYRRSANGEHRGSMRQAR